MSHTQGSLNLLFLHLRQSTVTGAQHTAPKLKIRCQGVALCKANISSSSLKLFLFLGRVLDTILPATHRIVRFRYHLFQFVHHHSLWAVVASVSPRPQTMLLTL